MINFDLDITKTLEKIDNVQKKVESAIRPAVLAGAQVYVDEVKIRAFRGGSIRYLKGKRKRLAGLLAQSIYKAYDEKKSNTQTAVYEVSWNKRKAPHGHLVEFGTSKNPKHPFLRPAYDAVRAEAEAVINEKLQEVFRKS